MGKRRNEDGLVANGTDEISNEAPVAKKPKKEKSTSSGAEISEKKASKKSKNEVNGSAEDAEAIAEAERKAARKAARKAEKAVKSSSKTNGAEVAEVDTEPAKKAEKAAKKAEKERKKAEKKASNSNGTSTTNGTSKVETSISRPEPSKSSNPILSGYEQAAALTAVPQADIDKYLTSKQITITDEYTTAESTYRPIINFSYLNILDEAERAPFTAFKSPTPIQAAAWPYLLSGRDVVGVAETGSGKTLAFGVPCMRYIKSLPKKERDGVKAVIVSPTRELALQIHEQLEKLATPAGLRSVCIFGGVPKYEQQMKVKKAHIVVATPGRLNDLLEEGSADISGAGYVVLDEADRMLDVGFEEAIRKIVSSTASKRQTLMFTATWPPSIRELASTFMQKPVRIIIGDNPDGELRANTRIKQVVEVIDRQDKNYRLLQLLKEHQSGSKKDDRILVFCLYKKEASRVEQYLSDKRFSVAGIHGDLSQDKRISALDRFKKGEVKLLVATDVAARGLDIPSVKVVINVTFPLTAEDYVHRIGRTGRAGLDGLAITLFTEEDKGKSGELINVLRAANQPVPEALLAFGTTVKKKEHATYGAFYKEIDTTKKATKITFD
ncbi:DEAD-domain-containing protein [Tothia fuscella]|uniref:RNA helicase n=1 Tax=Tothia fuscella TaxID=1048955 RepID=A0A9P4U4Q6_9PEZI|nr:DEAD-domain-containing protein [Tothia fuscella]